MTKLDRIVASARLVELHAGDRVLSPRGEVMHHEPRILAPGRKNIAVVVDGRPLGVMLFRYDGLRLLYCDREGRVHGEDVAGTDVHALMYAGMQRMAVVIREFLGERHPLANMASANKAAA